VKNVEEEVKTTSARGERIKKGLSNPSFGNKKKRTLIQSQLQNAE